MDAVNKCKRVHFFAGSDVKKLGAPASTCLKWAKHTSVWSLISVGPVQRGIGNVVQRRSVSPDLNTMPKERVSYKHRQQTLPDWKQMWTNTLNISSLKSKLFYVTFKNTAPTSKKTQHGCVIKINRLIILRKIFAVCDKYAKSVTSFSWQTVS
jgi:hypothetical protein